jgi:8-oxo-dGTP pyrophosphatase MutT (NUDIX family)
MHHACEEYVMLTYKVEPDAFVPPYATHYIGIGGVVINDKKEILVVSERYRSGSTPSFKLPGGALLAGEHLSDAVIREVKEETGIDTVFHKLTFFRHWHEYRYGKSDIYFVALLSPLNEKIDMQLDEIVDCKWMPLEEFMSDEHIHEFNKTIVESTFDSKGLSNIKIEEYKPDTRFEFYSS